MATNLNHNLYKTKQFAKKPDASNSLTTDKLKGDYGTLITNLGARFLLAAFCLDA